MTLPFYVPPEQLMKDRAEYARKGIARGRSIVAVEYADGILLMGENTSGTLQKISEIYDRIGFAGVGKYNEFESLRVAGIRHADIKGYSYGRRDVTAKGLANAYSQTLGNIFTQEVKPYEVEIVVAEVGDDAGGNRIFKITYDGTLFDERHYAVIGGEEEQLRDALQGAWEEGLDVGAAIRMVATVFRRVNEREVQPSDWEAAVLDRSGGRRTFRRLSDEEIAAALAAS